MPLDARKEALMRKRYQKGSLREVGGSWIAQWWENGHRRKRTLGRVREMTKSQAQTELAEILVPINSSFIRPSGRWLLSDFVNEVYFPFYKRKWKRSTASANEYRIRYHLVAEFGHQRLDSLSRTELQTCLDQKATTGLSFSTVDHLRWDLKQIFRMAVSEAYLQNNPADLLFTPREAARPERPRMSKTDVTLLLSVLPLRERLIAMLATIAGLRPGEIFGLCWRHVKADHLDIQQRIYRGSLDTPKTRHSIRKVAISEGVRLALVMWRATSICHEPNAWVFPSETLKTPLSKDNCWRRHIQPELEKVGLRWANFQVMRRTHSCLMRELNVDPKVVADQLGHTVDVNLNVYTKTDLNTLKEAVDTLESALKVH